MTLRLSRRAFVLGTGALACGAFADPAQRGESISVRDARFGARGDGVADDSRAIQAAVDFLSARGGGIASYPPGTYLIARPVKPKSGVIHQGAGNALSVIKGDGALSRLFRNVEDATIQDIGVFDLGFDLNGYNAADFATAISLASVTVQRIRIERNRFFDSNYPGNAAVRQRIWINVLPAIDCWFNDNQLSHGGRIKFGRGRPGSPCAARNVYCQRNRIDYVNDNAISFVDAGSAAAPAGLATENVHVTDNLIVDPTGSGIFFGGDGQNKDDPGMALRHIVVARNVVRLTTPTGRARTFKRGLTAHLPAGPCEDIAVLDNRIQRDFAGARGDHGIVLQRVDNPRRAPRDVVIRGNVVLAPAAAAGTTGIAANPGNASDSAGWVIERNRVEGFERGIDTNCSGTLTRWTWRDNTVRAVGIGIELRGNPALVACEIVGNEVSGAAAHALRIVSTSAVELRVAANRLRDAGRSALEINAASSPPAGGFRIDLVDNDLRGAGAAAVSLRGGAAFHAASRLQGNRQ